MSIQDVKDGYTQADWNIREAYYAHALKQIDIPLEPDTKTIMRLTSLTDSLLSEALLELAYIKRKYNDYKTKMTLSEKEAFTILKRNNIPTNAKITEKEITGMVVEFLKTKPLDNMQISIYKLVQNAEYRLGFIEAVVKILTEKKSALLADISMIKVEKDITAN